MTNDEEEIRGSQNAMKIPSTPKSVKNLKKLKNAKKLESDYVEYQEEVQKFDPLEHLRDAFLKIFKYLVAIVIENTKFLFSKFQDFLVI